MPYHREAWAGALLVLVLLCLAIFFIYDTGIKSSFQRQCEADGNFWLQSVPMRDGRATSSNTVTGCTLNIGLYHFAEEGEYLHFLRPREGVARLEPVLDATAGTPVQLAVLITDSKGNPVQELTMEHDRYLHTIIVGSDLEEFAHLHAEDEGRATQEMLDRARFPMNFTFNRSGRYAIFVDYVVGAQTFSDQFELLVEGEDPMAEPLLASQLGSQVATFEGYDIELSASPERPRLGEPVRLTYRISREGRAVTDLEPYLAATMHIAVVRDTLGSFSHTHGEIVPLGSAFIERLGRSYVRYHSHFVPDTFGPEIGATVIFPERGTYVLFGEFKHEGKVVVTRFAITV